MDIGSILLILIPLVIGTLTYYYQPFKKSGYSQSGDLIVMITMGCFLFAVIGTMLVQPTMDQERDLETCGSKTIESQCYRLPRLVCTNMWNKYEAECLQEIRKDLGERVTALIGPALKKCTQKKFDKSLYYTRKNANTSICKEHFDSIKN